MRLCSFRVLNYRSINDSGQVKVTKQTGLVGRNESGKTNLLLALESLKPPGGKLRELSYAKDFPRDRHPDEYSEDLPVVETKWELSEDEKSEIKRILPRAQSVSFVKIGRKYKPERYVQFVDLPSLQAPQSDAERLLESLRKSIHRTNTPNKSALNQPLRKLEQAIEAGDQVVVWAGGVKRGAAALQEVVEKQSIRLTDHAHEKLAHLLEISEKILQDSQSLGEAEAWIVQQMPIFSYLAEYPELEGHQNIPAYLQRKTQPQQLTEADINFEKLMKVARLNPKELQQLLDQDHETRHQLTNRASAVVTRKLRELWKERPLRVRFNPDGQHFDTLISDPNALFDVEINLNERSRGFQWFFSFYVTFAADTQDGSAKNAILLLDEPGLHLHALGQRDLLRHFDSDFENQIIYTTHSPFMIPPDDISSIRTVTISEDERTVVHNTPVGDAKTIFPILHTLGVEITQTLFIGEWNLVVEGVTDYWYLSSVSDYVRDSGGTALRDDLVLTPAGTSSKVAYMVSLLTSHRLKAMVLLDEETQARSIANELIRSKLIRDGYVVFASEAFEPLRDEADIEDLIDPELFDELVRESYREELAGKKLSLNQHIPRIAKRYEMAFADLGLSFHKTRPARLFLRRMADKPESIMTEHIRLRFERLFAVINERFQRLRRRDDPPFH